jgi:putative ABC transport system permease protein
VSGKRIHRENIAMALETLMAHKFRSLLTILGIVIGVLVVIVIASILTGMRAGIISIVEEFGTNNIFAFHLGMMHTGRIPREEWQRKPLTVADAKAIKELCPSVRDVAVQGISMRSPSPSVKYRDRKMRQVNFMGVSPNYAAVVNLNIGIGRFFTEVEDTHRMEVVVLGIDAAQALFPYTDPIGKKILIDERPFTVVGVLAKAKGGFLGQTNGRDIGVCIPYGTYHKLMPWQDAHLLMIQTKPNLVNNATDEIESLLRRRRGLKPSEPDNFSLSTAEQMIQQFDAITGTMGVVAIAISAVGLLVGGIGVMNIMLVSVTERTREIGIRKAIGATKHDIVSQFLFEAMTLTGVGGVFGVLLAILASYIIMAFLPDLPALIPAWAVITGLVVSIAVGLIFGVWPARKAANLDPIDALRYE